jgi:hypothetical protein
MERFSSTLLEYLKYFAQYYRQDVPSEGALLVYQMGLQHLNEVELKAAFQESIQKCQFFPSVKEMLDCLNDWKDRQSVPGTATHYEKVQESAEDKAIWDCEMGALFNELKSKSPEPMPGQRWTAEDGWLPREESWRRELERDARATKPVAWHAPIVVREPGED